MSLACRMSEADMFGFFFKKAIRNAAVHQLALKLGEEHFQSLFWTTSML